MTDLLRFYVLKSKVLNNKMSGSRNTALVFVPDRPPTQWQAPIYYEGRFLYWWPQWGWRPIEWTPPPRSLPVQTDYQVRDAAYSSNRVGDGQPSCQQMVTKYPQGGTQPGPFASGQPRGVMYAAQPSRPYFAGYTRYGRTPVNQYGYYTYYSYPYNDLGESRSYYYRY